MDERPIISIEQLRPIISNENGSEAADAIYLTFHKPEDKSAFLDEVRNRRCFYEIVEDVDNKVILKHKDLLPPTDSDLLGALHSHGLNLELSIAMQLEAMQLDYKHSVYYTDPVTAKAREMDFVIDQTRHTGRVKARLIIPIECKDCRNDAIIGAESRRRSAPSPGGNVDLYLLPKGMDSSGLRLWSGFGNIVTSVMTYRDTPRNREDSNFSFSAMQALSHYVYDTHQAIEGEQEANGIIPIYFPILVTHARLSSGKKASESIFDMRILDQCTVLWNYTFTTGLVPFITICQPHVLGEVLRRVFAEFQALGDEAALRALASQEVLLPRRT